MLVPRWGHTFTIWLLLLAGCDRLLQLSEVTLDDAQRAIMDAPTSPDDTPDAQVCLGQAGSWFTWCIDRRLDDTLSLHDETVVTNTDPRCIIVGQSDGNNVCVIAAGTITVVGRATAIGPYPLVLAAATNLLIDNGGIVDAASSRAAGRKGAGANHGTCASPSGAKQLASTIGDGGGGGGPGGSFHGTGGDGGAGDTATSSTAAPVASVPGVVRGGCPGGVGGKSHVDGPGGIPGDSGGAIYLIARDEIEVRGKLFAYGAGGRGGVANTTGEGPGGGGGGSGGSIGLDAPVVRLAASAVLFASGGGGAGGGNGTPGGSGGDGNESLPAARAGGGLAAPGAGAGGMGSAPDPDLDGASGLNYGGAGGAGGGGGGAGFIKLIGPTLELDASATMIPSPS